jgi:hypothetical protein
MSGMMRGMAAEEEDAVLSAATTTADMIRGEGEGQRD